MKRVKIIGITLMFSLLFGSVQATTNKILEKEYQESFNVNEDAVLVVENKYGDVFLTSWDKKEIKIDVIVRVEAQSSRSKATEVFENIEIDINGGENLVKAITHFPSFNNSGSMQINIDYYVSLPETVELDIEQKYGNVILNNNWTGQTNFELKYGNLQTRGLANQVNEIEIAYGELIAEDIKRAVIEVSYSDAQVENVETLDLHTSYSDIELGDVGSFELKSGFDDIEVEGVVDMYARTNYSGIEIDKLQNSLEIDLNYGDISIDYVSPNFKLIEIDSNNASVDIEMDESASYYVDVLTKYGDFDCRYDEHIRKEKRSFKSYRYTGHIGSSKNAGKIYVDANYANIEIK